MALRPVYVAIDTPPYYRRVDVEFSFFPGFSLAQKRRNIEAIHRGFSEKCPDMRILEISGRSPEPLGVALSAFHLKLFVPSAGVAVPVENAYQGGKIFRNGGPYPDLLFVSPREAKRDLRLRESGPLTGFVFEGESFPLIPENAFYDGLYHRALAENPHLAAALSEYDAFTDIEFNPQKSRNCQARAAAVFVGMGRAGKETR